MLAMLQKSLSALLVFLLCIMTSWHGVSAVTSQNSSKSASVCKCCDSHGGNCPTPACCAQPPDSRAPSTPAAPRSVSGNEWHAIPPEPMEIGAWSVRASGALKTAPPFIHAGAVPIFQRDCSYLI